MLGHSNTLGLGCAWWGGIGIQEWRNWVPWRTNVCPIFFNPPNSAATLFPLAFCRERGLVSFKDISPSAFEVTLLFLGETMGCRGFIRPLCVSSSPLVCLSLCHWPLGVVNESNPPSWYRVQAAASSGATWLLVPWRTGSCMTECAHLWASFLCRKWPVLFFFFKFVWLYFYF